MMGFAPLASRLSAPKRWPLTTAIIALAVTALIIGGLVTPYIFKGVAIGKEIADQIRVATGLQIKTQGAVRFRLLPRPNIVADGITVIDPSGALSIEALRLQGDVRFLPLLVGRVELTGATLFGPHLLIDLDSHPTASDNTIGHAINGSSGTAPSRSQALGIVTLVNGSAILKSRQFSDLPKFDNINLTIDWPDLTSPATMTGSANIRKVATDFSTWVAQPSSLMRGGRSDVTINLHSTPLDVSATGELDSSNTPGFRGHLVASSPSVSDLMAIAGVKTWLPAPLVNFSVASDATLTMDHDGQKTLDLPNLHLRADDNSFDGTVAIQGGAKPLFAGTLASDQLNLGPFLKAIPAFVDDQRRWSQNPVRTPGLQMFGLDLRISAAKLRIAPLTIDDAAVSIMTREGRTEVGLIEGKAYGGSIRARLSIGSDPTGLSVRGAGSLADVDAATLGWDLLGRQVATGTMSGSASLETSGESPDKWIHHLSGSAKATLQDGELSTLDLSGASHDTAEATAVHGRTPFQALSISARIGEAIASIERGSIRDAVSSWALAGQIDLGRGTADLTAAKTGPDVKDGQTLLIAGPLAQLVVTPRHPPSP